MPGSERPVARGILLGVVLGLAEPARVAVGVVKLAHAQQRHAQGKLPARPGPRGLELQGAVAGVYPRDAQAADAVVA